MKQFLIFLALVLIAATGAGQNMDGSSLNETTTTEPRFLGHEYFVNGELKVETIQDYLNKAVVYPKESMECFKQGTEVVEFIVTAEGEPTAFKVLNSVCPFIDKEVIRKLKTSSGKWAPGTVNGNPTDMQQEVAVVFTLCSCEKYMKKALKFFNKGNNLLFIQNKPKKALNYYNRALILLPNNENFLAGRSLCRYATGDETGAENDWDRIKVLAQRHNNMTFMKIINERSDKFKAYEEMIHAQK